VSDPTAAIPTRERVKATALALFLERGYRGATVRDIAEVNGISVPSLYYHFTNKDDLLAAIVEPFAVAGEALMTRLEALDLPADRFAVEALGGYYDVLAAHLDIFRFVSTDYAVRGHAVAGHLLAAQAARFLELLAGSRPARRRRVCALAAIGAIRRPLRAPDIEPVADRAQIIAAAVAAYGAVLAGPTPRRPPSPS
jgi:AcrR family transcriptional regulator